MIKASIIDDFSMSILLRHLKGMSLISPIDPRVNLLRDLEFLEFHWSISRFVRDLTNYLFTHTHEAQTLLTFRRHVSDAIARGRIDAKATIVQRLTTGLTSSVVSFDPVRSYASGPNHVLGWVLNQSLEKAIRFKSLSIGTGYLENIETTLDNLNRIRRLHFFRSIVNEVRLTHRPVSSSLVTAKRSRKKLYQLAYEAYEAFIAIERGDIDVISDLLKDTLLVPLEDWRRLELAVALALGEALSLVLSQPLFISVLGSGNRAPIIKCGQYSIYWQNLTDSFIAPTPEPSEQRVLDILTAYGMQAFGDRPDLIVMNESTGEVVSIVEVKFHSGDNPTSRFREAIHQIVRYSRGYTANPSDIIDRSAIVMNVPGPVQQYDATGIPSAFSFENIMQGHLSSWIRTRWPL